MFFNFEHPFEQDAFSLFVLSLRWTPSNLGLEAVPESQAFLSWARHGIVVKRSQALGLRDLRLNHSPITSWPARGCGHKTVETALWGLKGKMNVKHGTEQKGNEWKFFFFVLLLVIEFNLTGFGTPFPHTLLVLETTSAP